MNFWKVIFATIVIFGAGVFTGGLLVNDIDHSHHPRSAENPQRPPENRGHENHAPEIPHPALVDKLNRQFLQQLDDKLQLSAEQHQRIEKIIADGQERNRDLWTNVAPKMRAVMQDVNRQIREQLSAEQQKQFEELLKQFRPQHHPAPTNSPPVSSTNISRAGA